MLEAAWANSNHFPYVATPLLPTTPFPFLLYQGLGNCCMSAMYRTTTPKREYGEIDFI